MKTIAFTDDLGDRNIVSARDEESLEALITAFELLEWTFEIAPEDA